MPAGSADVHRLAVHRWTCHHLVAADHPAPEAVQGRVDEALRRALGSAVASCLDRAWPADDGALIFIRRLAVDLAIDASGDGAAIAAACARAFARELVQEVATGAGDNVVRFASRGEYVATYVSARARADGAPPWFFAAFAGWNVLGASAAIRSALVDEPATGRAALATLDAPARAAVAAALDEADGRYVVSALVESAEPADPGAALRAVLLAAASDPLTARLIDRPGLAVWLLAHALPGTDAETIRAGARVLRAVDAAARPPDAAALTVAVATVCADDSRLASLAAGAADAGTASAVPQTHTRLGGPFLLLDDLAALPLAEVCAEWPSIDGAAAVDLVRLIVLGHCLGAARWTRVFEEPFWRDVWRIGPGIGPAGLGAWLSALGPDRLRDLRAALAASAHGGGPPPAAPSVEAAAGDLAYLLDASGTLPEHWAALFAVAAQQTLRGFARRLPGFGASRCEYLYRNFLDVAARVQPEPTRIIVTLSRPPLDLVLGLTGRNRGERRWPDLDERPFVLFSGD